MKWLSAKQAKKIPEGDSYNKIQIRFWTHVRRTENCWEWIGCLSSGGYACFSSARSITGSSLAHRYSWALHFGEIPDSLFVLHHCDNRKCVHPEHLFLGTHADNMRDAANKGRIVIPHFKGELHPGAKLKTEDVSRIWKLLETESQTDIAIMFNVSVGLIWRIKHGLAWVHIRQPKAIIEKPRRRK